jgi:hypothetical protein
MRLPAALLPLTRVNLAVLGVTEKKKKEKK